MSIMKKNSITEILKKDLTEIDKRYHILKILLVFSVIILLFSFFTDIKNSMNDGIMDLRNRTVGARIYKHTALNPYTFKWNEKTDEKYVDPFDFVFGFKANRVTITPFVLWIHSLFCDVPYSIQRIIWNVLMIILSLVSLFLLLKNTDKSRKNFIIPITFLFVFASYFYRLHIDKGQIYILYVFLFSLSYFLYKRKKIFLSEVVLALLIAMRPSFLIVVIPFLLMKKIKAVFIVTVFAVLFAFVPVIGHGIGIYKQYFAAMHRHTLLHLSKIKVSSKNYPKKKVIDGVENMMNDKNYPLKDSSVQWLFTRYLHIKFGSKILLIFLMIILVPFAFVFYKNVNKVNDDILFLSMFLFSLIADFFLPAARLSYNNVFWIFPLVIILKIAPDKLLYGFPILILLVSFVLNLLYYVSDNLLVVSDYLFLIFVIISFLIILKHNGIDNA